MSGCFLTDRVFSLIYIIFFVILVALPHFYLLLFVCEACSQNFLLSAARGISKQLCSMVFCQPALLPPGVCNSLLPMWKYLVVNCPIHARTFFFFSKHIYRLYVWVCENAV